MFYLIAGITVVALIVVPYQLVSDNDRFHLPPTRSQSLQYSRERSHDEDHHDEGPHHEHPRQERVRDEDVEGMLFCAGVLAAAFFLLLFLLSLPYALHQFASADNWDPSSQTRSQSPQSQKRPRYERSHDEDHSDEDPHNEHPRQEHIRETLYGTAGLADATYEGYRLVSADDRDPPSPTGSQSHPPHERLHYGRPLASQEAYDHRVHALVEILSGQGRSHELRVERLNAEAGTVIFESMPVPRILVTAELKALTENNQDRPPSKVDLHGLTVKEAIKRTEESVANARQRGDPEVRLIVGRGNHSDGGIPKLKPAMRKAIRRRGLVVKADPRNPGMLVVVLDDRRSQRM